MSRGRERLHDRFFGRKLEINTAHRDSGVAGDIGHRRFGRAVLAEQLFGRAKNLVASRPVAHGGAFRGSRRRLRRDCGRVHERLHLVARAIGKRSHPEARRRKRNPRCDRDPRGRPLREPFHVIGGRLVAEMASAVS